MIYRTNEEEKKHTNFSSVGRVDNGIIMCMNTMTMIESEKKNRFQLFFSSPKSEILAVFLRLMTALKQPPRKNLYTILIRYIQKSFFSVFTCKYFLVHTRYGEEVIFITQRHKTLTD